jgi:chemotaxis protein CheX
MSRIDVTIVNPFLSAVVEVLGTMAQVRATPGKPSLKACAVASGDISGIIGLTGECTGTISVTFSARCALAVVGNMLAERLTDLDDTVIDAVGELTNMISGKARQGLAASGRILRAGTPSVITGRGHRIRHCCDGPVLALSFATLYGPITVEVCFMDKDGCCRLTTGGRDPADAPPA